MQLTEQNKKYWHHRAAGYSQVNQEELEGIMKSRWLDIITRHMPVKQAPISILDIGTGPGFFAIILAEAGYSVTAVDYTEEMLRQAKQNAGALCEQIRFRSMDAHHLQFPADSFDLIVTRNLTWNLEDPEAAYTDWHRVLKKDGVLLNFDANWYTFLFDEKERFLYEQDRENTRQTGSFDYYQGTDIDEMEAIARKVPLSQIRRPLWDKHILEMIGFRNVAADPDIWQQVWTDIEKLNYHATPMFLVSAVK